MAEIVRHFRQNPCNCSNPLSLEDDYSPVVEGRISQDEWRVAFCELNDIARRNVPSIWTFFLLFPLMVLPMAVSIPLMASRSIGLIAMFVTMGVDFLGMIIFLVYVIMRAATFKRKMEEAVGCLNGRFGYRGVRFRFCVHRAYRSTNYEIVVTVEGVQIVVPAAFAYQQQQQMMPPMYGGIPVQPHGFAINGQPQYIAVPQHPMPAAPVFQTPPPGYFENKPLLGNDK